MPNLKYIQQKEHCPTSGKACFDDRALANSFINANHAHKWRCYNCPDCLKWHVTKTPFLGKQWDVNIIHQEEFNRLLKQNEL